MRNRIMVIGRDAKLRARLAQLVTGAGHRAEVAENFAHARRAGLEGVALAIVDPDGLAADESIVAQELRDAVGALLIVARPSQKRWSPDAVDIADETQLLARISEAVLSQTDSEAAWRILEFAGYRLDLAAHCLMDPAAREVRLTPGEFSLLRALANRAGRVLSRDRLLQLIAGREAEPYDRGVDMQVMRLRRKIEPDPERPTLIVTVPGAGYKFAAAVRDARPQEQARGGTRGAADTSSSTTKSEPPRLSMVVLPFTNLSGNPEQEHFADGITEGLTTDLSRIRGAVVIARNTAFSYKGKLLDVKTIGGELNVRYVLEGSVQRGGNRMRVNVQLIDAETGSHLWAERFDKPLTDLFDMQDEIVARLASALNAQLVAAEARRAQDIPNPSSMDLYFQGLSWLYKGLTPDNVSRARSFCERALSVDPDNVDALIGSAMADAFAGTYIFVTDPIAAFAAAEAKLIKALSSAPDHARGHMWLGLVGIWTKRAPQGIAECEHAVALDRNLATAHSTIGLGKIFIGHAEETDTYIVEALRLSPRDPLAYTWMANAGAAKLHLGDWGQAAAWFRRSIEANRNWPLSHFVLAAAFAQLDRPDEARSAVKAGLALNPGFTLSGARAAWTAMSDDPTYLARLEPIFEGMRKAEVPE